MPFKQDDYFQCYIILFFTRFVNELLVDDTKNVSGGGKGLEIIDVRFKRS